MVINMRHTFIITVVSLLLVVTMATGGYFAYIEARNRNEKVIEEVKTPSLVSGNASEIAEELFRYVHISADDKNAIVSLVNSIDYIGFEIDSINTDAGFLTVNYKVDSRTKYRFMDDYSKNFNQTCATLFVLADGLKNIRLTVSDNYGEFYSFSRDLNSFVYTKSMHDFSEDDLEDAAKNFDNFEAFTEKLLVLKSDTQNNVYLKQIYEVLAPSLQVIENSKEQFVIALDDNNLAILSALDLDLTKHRNTSVELYFCSVEDYTVSELKNYIFVFKEKQLIANDVISSPMLYEDTINLLK